MSLEKYLFVEFKHGKIDTEAVLAAGANKLMIAAYQENPDPKLIGRARKKGLR